MSRSKTQGDGTLTAIIAAFAAPVLTLGLAWLVGNSLTTRWDTVKKQAELDLAAMEQFYKIYGEFFAVWKLWEDAIQRNGGKRNELFERIAAAEAQLEALIVRISCQRALTQDEIHIIGAFRQAYQTLRKCMKHGQSLSADHGWNASNAAPYAAFKGLAASVAVLLRPEQISVWKMPSAPTQSALMAAQSLRALTSNAYEPWVLPTGQEVVVWEAVARNHGLLDIHEDWPPPIGDGSPYYHDKAVHRIS
jgi:hypothetical protein